MLSFINPFAMIGKFRKCLDRGGEYAALLTDLSKAFDCLPHDLLIAKLEAYGFDRSSLKLIYSYLTNRQQRVKINNTYSEYSIIKYGVPQGSILGPILFNIFLCDLFLIVENIDIASYADDNTPYCTGSDSNEVKSKLERASVKVFKWFYDNAMKANIDKCHFLSSLSADSNIKIEESVIKNSNSQKLLGITIDRNLSFNEHVSKLCKKASLKISALSRIFPHIDICKRKILMKAYFSSQFGYCPLVWMNHSRNLNNRINALHERALRLVYDDFTSSFTELLEKDNSVTIHQKNLQALAIEMFKVKNNIGPEILNEVFKIKDKCYNTRFNSDFERRNIKSVRYGSETLSSLGPQIWDLIPLEVRNLTSLDKFKTKIRSWKTNQCPCRLCKKFINNLGFLN